MNKRFLVSVAAVLTLHATPTAAQTALSPRGYVTYGSNMFASDETFDAITGESSKTGMGFGGTLLGIWRGVFFDGAVSQQKFDGERVFADGGTIFRLGIPVTIRMRPIDLAGGWRLVFGRLSPYAGAGVSLISYKETAAFAEPDDDVSESKTGAMFLGGVDVRIVRWLHAGGELRYRSVKGTLGEGGVSRVFVEDQLGGYSFAVRMSVGR
jgi:opacity protein-like surface antigen